MPLLMTDRSVDADVRIVVHNQKRETSDFKWLIRRAGEELRTAYEQSGIVLDGDPVVTSGFGLDEKHVIHILWSGDRMQYDSLAEQYWKALQLAQDQGCSSVILDLPERPRARRMLNRVCEGFLSEADITIYLAGSPRRISRISDDLLSRLHSFLDEGFRHDFWPMGSLAEDEDKVLACPVSDPEDEDAFLERPVWDEKPRPRPMPAPSRLYGGGGFSELADYLRKNDAGFRDTLLKYIDRTGKKDSEIYKKANVDRRLFSKIMNISGYNPSKPTAIAFAIALELDLEETKDLIGRAGYTLSKASTFDRIIEFFILEGNYNIYEINEALFHFDQILLGC